jgi:hypothetical protein
MCEDQYGFPDAVGSQLGMAVFVDQGLRGPLQRTRDTKDKLKFDQDIRVDVESSPAE